jgi:hypothetical protein
MIPMFLVLDLFDGIRYGPDHLLRRVSMVRVQTRRLLEVSNVAVDDLVREYVQVVLCPKRITDESQDESQ